AVHHSFINDCSIGKTVLFPWRDIIAVHQPTMSRIDNGDPSGSFRSSSSAKFLIGGFQLQIVLVRFLSTAVVAIGEGFPIVVAGIDFGYIMYQGFASDFFGFDKL